MQPVYAFSPRAILAKTRNLYLKLPPSEKAAADLLLAEAETVVSLSIGRYAQEAGVSKSSILRFCDSLGFGSYKDFKLALARELGQEATKPFEDVRPRDTPKDIFRKVIQADIKALEETLDLVDEASLSAAVDQLINARKIEIYGVGLSASIVNDAYSRFLRIGLNVSAITDAHMQAISASLLTNYDVAFAISHSGQSRETLRAAKLAQKAGATLIGLSSFLESPLIQVADIGLVSATGETAFRVDAMASRIAHLSVIDTLYVSLANKHGRRSRAMLERTSRVMANLTKG